MNRLAVLLSRTFCIAYGLVGLLLCGCSRHAGNAVQLIVDGHDIRNVVVLEVPRTVLTQKGYTPETLANGYHLKLEIRGGALLDRIGGLSDATSKTRCEAPGSSDDLRTAILFYDASGALIRSVHYGAEPSVGIVDGKPCSLNAALYQWVRTQIAE